MIGMLRSITRGVVDRGYSAQINARGGLGALRYLFIIGHTRSGSTLLTNILCSHPEVRGFGEINHAYHSPDDIDFLVRRVHFAHRSPRIIDGYVLDKILHDKWTPEPGTIDLPSAKYIVLLRDPVRSVKSWLGTFGGTEEDAVNYLENRLRTLPELTQRYATDDRARWLTYEDMLDDAPSMLTKLTGFLALRSPLKEQFRRQPRADVLGTGDPSERQHAGKILTEQRDHKHDIGDDSQRRLREAYDQALQRIGELCPRIRPAGKNGDH